MVTKLAVVLVLVGALNWGLVGAQMLFGAENWNVVNLLLGSWPTVEAIVYLLVGLAAIFKCVKMCMCKSCKTDKKKK